MELIGGYVYNGREVESEMNLIEEGLYLGSLEAARCEVDLRKEGITHIIGILDSFRNYSKIEGITYLLIPLADSWNSDITQHFAEAFSFITSALRSGKVLVHCAMGVSRSATIVTSYIMVKYSLSLRPAIEIVRKGRPCAYPNEGFQKQMCALEINEYKQYLE